MNAHNVPALPSGVWDILEEYEKKAEAIPAALEDFKKATTNLETSACVAGHYSGSIWSDGRYYSAPDPIEKTLQDNLRKSAWVAAYKKLMIEILAPASDRNQFKLSMENPPDFTEANILATFGDYIGNARFHLLRGLAEVFCRLDPAYKSHSKVKIGVSGLPKRIILSNVRDWGSWGYDEFRDTLKALCSYRGKPHVTPKEVNELLDDADEHGAAYWHGIEIRRFQNGNAHLIFDPETLREINLALAEFYGDTLPDSPEDNPKKRPGTDVAANLAYYPTPPEVVERILNSFCVNETSPAFLEPSCGCGRIMDGIAQRWPMARTTGVEYDKGRTEEARSKGHHVQNANFLQAAPNPAWDYVIMNPPFNGQHWKKHIRHALKFLKPGGLLISILPASAYYDGHLEEFGVKVARGSGWMDLPVASFAASGTNIPTGYVTLGA